MCSMGQQSGSPTPMRPAGAPPAVPRPVDVMPRVARSPDPAVARANPKLLDAQLDSDKARFNDAMMQAEKMDRAQQEQTPNRAAKGDREDIAGPTVIESIAPDQPVEQPSRPVSKTPPQVQEAEAGPGEYEEAKSRSTIAKKGDSLARIAKREGVPLQTIIAANPQLRDPDKIRIGQRIFLPKLRME